MTTTANKSTALAAASRHSIEDGRWFVRMIFAPNGGLVEPGRLGGRAKAGVTVILRDRDPPKSYPHISWKGVSKGFEATCSQGDARFPGATPNKFGHSGRHRRRCPEQNA
jgi:hypothetical protein